MKKSQSLDKYNILIKQILALHFSGCYITNKELLQIAKNIGIDEDLTDRETLLKKILTKAINENKEVEFFNELSKLLKNRFDIYSSLAKNFPNSIEIINIWMQKLRSLNLLIRQRIRMSPYEQEIR